MSALSKLMIYEKITLLRAQLDLRRIESRFHCNIKSIKSQNPLRIFLGFQELSMRVFDMHQESRSHRDTIVTFRG